MKIVRVLLTVLFAWSALKGVEVLLRTDSVDYRLFDSVGAVWAFYVASGLLVIFQLAAVVWIWTDYAYGLFSALAAVVGAFGLNVAGGVLAVRSPEVAKAAFIASRESRGLTVKEGMVELVGSLQFTLAVLSASAAFAALVVYLLIRVQRSRQKIRTSNQSLQTTRLPPDELGKSA